MSSLNRNITKNKADHLLVQNEFNKLKIFDSSYYNGKKYFEEGGKPNYIIFQPLIKYFKLIDNTKYISSWESKGLYNETITPYATSDNSLTPLIDHYSSKIRLKLNKSCLKQLNKLIYSYGRQVNVYIVYELGASGSSDSNPTLKNFLFGAVTLTKNTDIEKYWYSGDGNGFYRRESFSFPGGGFGQNVIIFGEDMNSSSPIDNKGKNILILGIGPTQGLEHTLTAEKMYSINFTVTNKKFCLILHYNGANSYLFVNGKEIYKFKAKDYEISVGPISLGNISKDWSVDNMKRTGFTDYVYDFSVDYHISSVDDIKDEENI